MGIRGRELNVLVNEDLFGDFFREVSMYFASELGREVVVWMEQGLGRPDGISLVLYVGGQMTVNLCWMHGLLAALIVTMTVRETGDSTGYQAQSQNSIQRLIDVCLYLLSRGAKGMPPALGQLMIKTYSPCLDVPCPSITIPLHCE